jgi:hypothetical protein
VGILDDEASRRVLLAGDVQLDDAQLKVALDFCKGLPLALTLLNGALRAEDDPAGLIQRLQSHGTFSVDAEDELVSELSFSVERLSEDLKTAWLDLAWMYAGGVPAPPVVLGDLKCLFGEHTLQKLQHRSLITLREILVGIEGLYYKEIHVGIGGMYNDVQVVLHDVLLRMAQRMCGPQGANHCLTLDTRSISLTQGFKVSICRCEAISCHVWRQNGFAVEQVNWTK